MMEYAPASQLDTSDAQDVALEDFDELFDAVVSRLRLNVEQWNGVVAAQRRETWGQVRTNLLECVSALDQLHLTATHAFAEHHQAAIEALLLRPIAPLLPLAGPPPKAGWIRSRSAESVATALPAAQA